MKLFIGAILFVYALALAGCGVSSTGVENTAASLDSGPPQAMSALLAVADECGNMSELECDVFREINLQRSKKGMGSLSPSQRCTSMAQSHSADMALNGYFSHTSPKAGGFSQRADSYKVGGYAAENIAQGSLDIPGIVKRWMNSAGHRKNILNGVYNGSGVGVAASGQGYYFTQCFSSQF